MSEDKRISPELIADIFDIPVNGQNINDDDETENAQEKASAPFETMVQERVVSEIQKTEPNKVEPVKLVSEVAKAVPEVVKKPEPKSEPKPVINGSVEDVLNTTKPKKTVKTIEPDMFDGLPDPEPEAPKVEAPKVETPKNEPVIPIDDAGVKVEKLPPSTQDAIKKAIDSAAVEFEKDETEKEASRKKNEHSDVQWVEGEQWLLKSPAPKYNRFYEEKANVLNDSRSGILAKGMLDFDNLFDELASLHCDMTVTTYDTQAIHEKMVAIQQLRERVREIQLVVSRQYFLWKRYIELFRGVLAGAEYIRGKQDGVCYDHMRDMEHYFCSLEALHKGTETIFKTLDAAFDVLSRQVTIIMPMKEIDRQMPNTNTSTAAPKPMTTSMKKFDSLETKVDKPAESNSKKASAWGYE